VAEVSLGRYLDTWYRCQRDSSRDLGCATYVVGIQGMGKSTLLANLAEQFVAAGEGVIVIDTRGELAEDIASRTLHPDRLIYVAPGEYTYPTGQRFWTLNPLEFDRSQPHLESIAVSSLLSLMDRMDLADLKRMPQLRQVLSMTAQLALALPQPTLQDLLDILGRPVLRARLLAHERFRDNLAIQRFWDGYNELTPRQQREKAASTLPRLTEFLTNDVVRHLVSAPRSTIRLAEWLDAGQLVVCNLGSRLGGDVRRLLGNFVVASLVNATYARLTVNQGDGRTWRVIVDEFHELAGDQFAEIIEQGRKYRVFPVVAHQNLSQLSERLTNAVASCQLRFFLRASPEDQAAIRRLFGTETSEGITHLPRFQARVHFNEGPEGRFRVETLRLPDWWAPRSETALLAARNAAQDDRFTVPAGAIDPAIAVSAPPEIPAPAAIEPNPEGDVDERHDRSRPTAGDPDQTAALPARPEPDSGLPPEAHSAGLGRPGSVRPARALDEWPA
jgi:hypothetical protein